MAKSIKRQGRASAKPERSDTGPATDPAAREGGRRQTTRRVEQLLLLTLAIAFGLIGLGLHVLWIVSIVLMALLWGFMAAELGSSRREGGVVSDVVTAVVSETREVTKDITHAASEVGDDKPTRSASESETASAADDLEEEGAPANPDSEPTKKELYVEAREAGIQGRSNMTKEELQQALDD
jgi:hypothetical protein